MPPTTNHQRLSKLRRAPTIAGMDHRHFLDEEGKDTRLKTLSRQERRKLSVETKRIAREYKRIVRLFSKSGAGYPVDKLLRELCVEYTNRYASAGYFSQPVNFNYFEPFCNIDFIENTIAPFAEPAPELDHLFSIIDYLDYTTSSDRSNFDLAELRNLPEGKVLHFTTNGDLGDFTFLAPEGREFVVSGFSMVRHSYLLHWYLVGGEVLSSQEWKEEMSVDIELSEENVSPYKQAFLGQNIDKNGNKPGAPIALEGTETAIRTIIAGATDLNSCKHVERFYMSERENSFLVTCDDPDVFQPLSRPVKA